MHGPFLRCHEISATSVRYHARDARAAICDEDENEDGAARVSHSAVLETKEELFDILSCICSGTTLGDLRSMLLNKLPVVNEGFFMFLNVPSDSCSLQFP